MSRRVWALFALLSVAWGVPCLMIKVPVAEVSVPFLVCAQAAVGAAVLLPIALRDRGFAPLRGHWIPVAGFALVENDRPVGSARAWRGPVAQLDRRVAHRGYRPCVQLG
jgi:hypothetical protein